MKTHKHQCGRTAGGMLEGVGCGHIFEHEDKPGPPTVSDHRCPKCGAAPWYHKLGDRENEARAKALMLQEGSYKL